MEKIKKVYPWIIIVLLSVYLSLNLTNMLIPQPQFTVDLSEMKNNKVTIYTYHNKGTAFPMDLQPDGSFATHVGPSYFLGKNFQISLNLDKETETVSSAIINGKALSKNQIIKVTKYSDYTNYSHLTVLRQQMVTGKVIVAFCGIFLLLFILLLEIYTQTKNKNKGKFLEKLTYSSAWLAVGKKSIILSFIIAVASIIIYRGCDIAAILGTINLHQLGIDTYQLQASSDSRLKVELLIWTYNYTMLMFYNLATFVNRLLLPLFTSNNYYFFQYIIYKLVNMLLINLTVLSIISFLIDHNVVKPDRAKSIYCWSVFNPLTFYIAIIFIQLDVFPAYCLTIGLLLLAEIDKNYWLSAFLLAVGVSAKLPISLLVPVILLALLCIIVCRKEKTSYKVWHAVQFLAIFVFTTFLFFLAFYIRKGPMYNFLTYIPQSERAWWTVLAYAPTSFLYISVFVLVIAVLLNLFTFSSKLEQTNIIINGLYYYGIIVLLFSFAILSTPSTLLHTLAAFTLLYAVVEDKFQRTIIASFSLMIVFEVLFTSIGDISGTLQFFGKPAFFTQLETSLSGTGKGIKYTSVLQTISHATMVAYAILFYKYAKVALTHKSDTPVLAWKKNK